MHMQVEIEKWHDVRIRADTCYGYLATTTISRNQRLITFSCSQDAITMSAAVVAAIHLSWWRLLSVHDCAFRISAIQNDDA